MGVHRASRESRVHQDHQVPQEARDYRATTAAPGHRDRQDPQVPLDPTVHRGPWVRQVPQDLLDIRY